VFTWFGATIEMDGGTETDYTADEVSHCSSPIECFVSRLLVRQKKDITLLEKSVIRRLQLFECRLQWLAM